MFRSLKLLLTILLCLGFIGQAVAQTPTAKDYFEQGLKLVKERKLAEALTAFQKSAQLDPKQPAAQAAVGSTLLQMMRETEAVAAFREAVRLAPSQSAYRVGLCQSLSLSKKHAEAITECEEAVRLDAASSEPRGALAAALRTAGRTSDALRIANAALERFPENEMLLNVAAEINSEMGSRPRATEIYEILARIRPNSVLYQVKLAENYLRLERDAESIAAAGRAIELEKHPMAYFFLGNLYFELGQSEEAAEAFRQAVVLDDKFAEAYFYLGVSENRRGKTENAIAALKQAVRLAPDNFDYNKELGSMLNSNEQHDEAIAVLRKAVSLKPNDWLAKTSLGLALFESLRFEEGISVLMEADRLQPGHSVINMFLNVARSRQRGLAQVEEMKRYAKENPQDVKVRMHLLEILGYCKRLLEAEPYITEVLQLKPKDVDLYVQIGVVYISAGKLDKAFEILQKSLAIQPNPGAYLNLTTYYIKRGQPEEALKAYAKVLELKPDVPNVMKGYADLLRDTGKRREALEMYKRSLAMLPTNPPALFNAGVLSAKFGDFDSARQYLETLKSVDPESAKKLSRIMKLQQN
ncbi:MAG: tetratricopeptide repeat protein [Acidobacteriota bacterium]|nr:tetratricopeptide repeat protein [Acidobacteriota bacterium]